MADENNSDKPAESVEAEQHETERGATGIQPHSNDEAKVESDTETDRAVEDIVKKEGDDVLKAQDEADAAAIVMKPTFWERFKNWNALWWANPRKRWGTIVALLAVLAAVFAIPFTRYNILGIALKTDVTVQVVDSKSGAPVSGATVQLSGVTAESQANGRAVLHVNTGSGSLKVTKKYYTGYTHGELVSGGNTFKATLVATGRQVAVKLVNKITGKPLSGATITAGGAKAKSDSQGMATLVIPSGADSQAATITLADYNDTKATIVAAGGLVKNTFSVTPAGKLYFLSNLSGTIDVVKTNLDGTDRQTVLAGTGSEDANSTSLLASRDWKYLALLSKRSGNNASVYLIDTTNGDKLSTIDEGDAQFTLVGWSGDRFIYRVHRNTVQDWQSNQEALKSFDPTTGHTLLLDQTQGSGSGQNDYYKQSFGQAYLIGNQVVYAKDFGSSYIATNQTNPLGQATLETIGSDGSGHKVLKTFTQDNGGQNTYLSVDLAPYEPNALYIRFYNSGADNFYDYEDGKVTTDTSMTSDKYYQSSYATYLLSPSGNQTFWSEARDGKNTLFVGDQNAKGPKTIASLSDYGPYAWYSDNYLLVSKNSSELYIMPVAGGAPLKVTDYYKPAISYQGYGGGYGGL